MASLTDPLTLMREFASQRSPLSSRAITSRPGGRFPRSAKTAYRNTGPARITNSTRSTRSGPSCRKSRGVCQILRHNKIPVVHLKDRTTLLDYLEGRSEGDAQAIDYSQYVPVQPVSADASADSAAVVDASAAVSADVAAAASSSSKRWRARASQRQRRRSRSAGRKAFKRILAQATGVPGGGAADDGESSAGRGWRGADGGRGRR